MSPGLEQKVFQAISRISHYPLENLKGNLKLKEDLGLDSLNFMELEYELQQSGFPEFEVEEMAAIATVGEVIDFLRAK
jgi:acyl carrier protein